VKRREKNYVKIVAPDLVTEYFTERTTDLMISPGVVVIARDAKRRIRNITASPKLSDNNDNNHYGTEFQRSNFVSRE
jgi:hypothetical protein